METSNKTARELYQAIKERPQRPRFGFGRKAAVVNIDLQRAYTNVGKYVTAYETHPDQMRLVNELAELARGRALPVVWTFVAYMDSGEDACAWGIRTNTPDSLQNIKHGSDRAEFDQRLTVDRVRDVIICKRMASAFHETNLNSLLVWHGIDTVIVTGGSTSGCVRATVVDALSHGFRAIVPEECVADKHESPHFANLYDMALKYADVVPAAEVIGWLRAYAPANR